MVSGPVGNIPGPVGQERQIFLLKSLSLAKWCLVAITRLLLLVVHCLANERGSLFGRTIKALFIKPLQPIDCHATNAFLEVPILATVDRRRRQVSHGAEQVAGSRPQFLRPFV